MEQTQVKQDYDLISDYWKFTKQCLQLQDWTDRHSLGLAFATDHGNSRFSKELVLALFNELERREMQK